MKGYMKKMKTNRVLAMLLAVLIVLTISIPQNVSAESPDAKYTGTGNIKDLLTDFQYVIKGDATLYNHTVGSVAIGGNLNSYNYIGDCAQRPSYAKHIIATGIGNASDFMGSTRDFYYGTSNNTLNDPFMQNPGYMDVPSLYVGSTGLVEQSKTLAADNVGKTATSELDPSQNFQMITIDFGVSNTWTIPYDVLKTAKGINFVNSSNADGKFEVNDLSSEEYLINIVGVNSEEVLFDGEEWKGAEGTNYTDLFVNGAKGEPFLAKLANPVNGVQCNLSGMKLIWNFPDATGTVMWHAMGGHLVAPQASVNVTSGRFEGGIIASSVVSSGQAHYFPYNKFGISEDGTKIVANDIFIKKTYYLDNGTSLAPVYPTDDAAKFTLYEDEACTVPVSGAVDVPVDNTLGYVTFDSEALGLELERSYYVKETHAPKGFEIDKETVYECAISVGGMITYKAVGNSSYSSAVPVYENLSRTYTDVEQNGTLVVTVEDIDNNRAKVKDATIQVAKINNDSSKTTIAVSTTPDSGVVSFTSLEPGKYEVSLIIIPEGYDMPSEKVVTVNVQTTGYHTFELSQKKEDIVVDLIDAVTGGPVSGGYVEVIGQNNGKSYVQYVGSTGTVTFKDLLADKYDVILVQTPKGYNDPDPIKKVVEVSTKDNTTDNSHTFVLNKQVGIVKVNVLDVADNTDVTSEAGCEVKITYPDGTTWVKQTDAGDGNTDDVVTFTNVPVGECKIEVSTAPTGYILIANPGNDENVKASSKKIDVEENDITEDTLYVEEVEKTGNLVINVVDTKPAETCDGTDADNKVIIKITAPDGSVTTDSDVYIDNTTITMNGVPVGTYTIDIQTPNGGWKTIKAEVVDGTTDTTTPISINAGVTDGETTTVVFTVDAIGNLKVTVVDESNSDAPVSGATVVIKKDDQEVKEVTTGNDGTVTVNGLITGDYTVEVTDVPEGKDYVVPTAPETVTVVQNSTVAEEIKLSTTGTLEINVREKGTPNPIADATVYLIKDGGSINDSNDVLQSQHVDNTGDITFTGIAPGAYDVVIDADAIADTWELFTNDTQDVTVSSGENGPVLFELTKQKGNLIVEIVDENGDPVRGPETIINVKDEDGNPVSLTNSSFDIDKNKITNKLPVGDYKVTIEQVPDDYMLPDNTTQDAEVVIGDETITFVLKEVDKIQNLGNLRVNVYLKDETPENLSDNQVFTNSVKIKYVPLSGASVTETINNLSAIKLDKTGLPAGNYTTVLTIPDGYTLVADMAGNTASQTKAVVAGETTVINYVLEAAGTINVTVRDDDGTLIPGADVVLKEVIKDDEGNVIEENKVAEGTTDSNGKVTFTEVPVGDYIVEITDVPNEYDMPEDTKYDVVVTSGVTVNEVYELPLAGDITAIVYEYGTTNEVKGASVVLELGGVQVGTEISDEDGKVYFSDLADGTYTVKIIGPAPGYSIVSESIKPSSMTVELKAGSRDKSADFYVDALGDMEITIVEDGTNDPIPGAQVQIIGSKGNVLLDGTNGNDYFTTSAAGTITVNDIPADTYTVKVTSVPTSPIAYKLPYGTGTSTVTVVKNDIAKEEFIVAATTSLTITVKDEETGDVLDNDSDGKTTLEVTDQYGEKKVVTTTSGTVTIDNWAVSTPGNPTTVTITKVPSTHIVPTEADKVTTTVEVVKGANSHDVEAPQKPDTIGDLIITVKDEVLNTDVPNAYVEITYPDGSKEFAYSDSDGKISRPGVTTGNYTVTIISVPQGYTPPSQTVSKITVTTGKNKLEIVIKTPVITGGANTSSDSGSKSKSNKTSDETVVKAPKTGDISYMPFAIAMMVISLIGLAGVTVYRRKMENEE